MRLLTFFLFFVFSSQAGLLFLTPMKAITWKPTDETGMLIGYQSWTGTITQSSNLVSAWTDISTNNYNAGQATGARQPTYESNTGPNSVPVVFFTNTSDMIINNNNQLQLLNTARGHTLYVVGKFNALAAGSALNTIFCSNSGSTNRPCFGYRPTNSKFEFDGPASWVSTQYAQSTNTTNWHKMCWTYNGSGSTTSSNFNFYYDGGSATTINTTGSGNGSNTVIGNYLDGSDTAWAANMRIVAIYMWDHEISSTVRAKLDTYLNQQIGL